MSNLVNDFASVPVVILCGGNGILIDDSGQRINKTLVHVAGKAMITWIMLHYAEAGFRKFILAAGYQKDQLTRMLVTDLGASESNHHFSVSLSGASCIIDVVSTPVDATTGDRLNACRAQLDNAEYFGVTYSDTLSDINLADLVAFHLAGKQTATLVAAEYPVRFRILGMRLGETIVRGFALRPVIEMAPINGGFYFFNHAIFDERYLGKNHSGIILEDEVLNQLASDGKLRAFHHKSLWQNLDSERDFNALAIIANKQFAAGSTS